MRPLSNAPATVATLVACLVHPMSVKAFVSTTRLLLPRHCCRALPAADSNTPRWCSRQQCQMIGVDAIPGRKQAMALSRKARRRRPPCAPLALDVTSGVSGDSGGDNRVDGELQRVPNIRGKMMEILRPDLKRVRRSSKAMHGTTAGWAMRQDAHVCVRTSSVGP